MLHFLLNAYISFHLALPYYYDCSQNWYSSISERKNTVCYYQGQEKNNACLMRYYSNHFCCQGPASYILSIRNKRNMTNCLRIDTVLHSWTPICLKFMVRSNEIKFLVGLFPLSDLKVPEIPEALVNMLNVVWNVEMFDIIYKFM